MKFGIDFSLRSGKHSKVSEFSIFHERASSRVLSGADFRTQARNPLGKAPGWKIRHAIICFILFGLGSFMWEPKKLGPFQPLGLLIRYFNASYLCIPSKCKVCKRLIQALKKKSLCFPVTSAFSPQQVNINLILRFSSLPLSFHICVYVYVHTHTHTYSVLH